MDTLFDIVEFVKNNAPYLTMSDMVDETGIPRHQIQKACDKLQIVPISKAEQTKQAIKYWASKKTMEEFMKMSGQGEASIKLCCKELGINFLQSTKKPLTDQPPLQSIIGKRLAGVRFVSDSNMYDHWVPIRITQAMRDEG